MTLQFLPAHMPPHVVMVAALAKEIWREHYESIIGAAQVSYMLAKFQSPEAIAEQIRTGQEYFLLFQDAAPLGYLAIESQPQEQRMFLSKIYLYRSARGRGLGGEAMDFVIGLCRARGLTRLWLTINKRNPVLQIYERFGFVRTAAVVMDIGGGFVMDDFRMEKDLV